jgi:hypothetical protein
VLPKTIRAMICARILFASSGRKGATCLTDSRPLLPFRAGVIPTARVRALGKRQVAQLMRDDMAQKEFESFTILEITNAIRYWSSGPFFGAARLARTGTSLLSITAHNLEWMKS